MKEKYLDDKLEFNLKDFECQDPSLDFFEVELGNKIRDCFPDKVLSSYQYGINKRTGKVYIDEIELAMYQGYNDQVRIYRSAAEDYIKHLNNSGKQLTADIDPISLRVAAGKHMVYSDTLEQFIREEYCNESKSN